jgi:hypothetical protein
VSLTVICRIIWHTFLQIIWHTDAHFRLLARLLGQMERVLAINRLEQFSVAVVETARENLVVGRL